jgi:hypothetical protein
MHAISRAEYNECNAQVSLDMTKPVVMPLLFMEKSGQCMFTIAHLSIATPLAAQPYHEWCDPG